MVHYFMNLNKVLWNISYSKTDTCKSDLTLLGPVLIQINTVFANPNNTRPSIVNIK